MKKVYLFLMLVFAAGIVSAQQAVNPLESTPYIEVTGEAELEIVPDEIYLSFTLQERYDGRDKSDLNALEKKLKKALSAAGFELENLTVANASSDFVDVRRRKQDVLASKNYQMKISNTTELVAVWDILDEVEAENATIARVDHSQMEQFKKQVKIDAVKNAKEKADYLLGALDENTGSVLFIQERQSYIRPMARQSMALTSMMEMADQPAMKKEESLSFQKIQLQYAVFVRFAIL